MTDKELMRKYIEELNHWTQLYDEGHPEVSDKEWDTLYFRLALLENVTGIYYADSPTQNISYKVVNQLNKVTHNHPMLSLAKTKSIDEVKTFVNDQPYIAMCKMDGITCSLRYLNGKLVSAETRGNGLVGEDILHNALIIPTIPNRINYQKELIVDGEIICKYDNFVPFEKEYKNPRNFAAGSIRLLNSQECKNRNLTFVAWDVIKGFEEKTNAASLLTCLDFLHFLGFVTVPCAVDDDITSCIEHLVELAKKAQYPIDGVVFKFNDREYGKTLGKTEHHFKNAIAYKFYDETYETTIDHIEWTMGRTGVLTPVAVFKPINIDGSTVERASLHNLSVLKELKLKYQGQKIEVFKANQIIPQIAKVYPYECETASVQGMIIPTICPVCGKPTEQVETDTSLILKCTNPDCEGKLINKLDHFCGKKGLDIKGLSKATLDKLISWGWVSSIDDLYSKLPNYKTAWMTEKTGFGEKSVSKILNAIEDSRHCELWQFISALGIPLIGVTYAKQIATKEKTYENFKEDLNSGFDFSQWSGFGYEMNNALYDFDFTLADSLIENELTLHNSLFIDPLAKVESTPLTGIIVVITGKLIHFKNRDALKAEIEKYGGKVAGSISGKTNYLINNDTTSTSSKNKAAQAAGIPILNEEEFIEKFLTS